MDKSLRNVIAGDVRAVAQDLCELLNDQHAQASVFGWLAVPATCDPDQGAFDRQRITFTKDGREFSLVLRLENGGGK